MPRLTIEFPNQVDEILKDLAKKGHTTKVDVIRRALALYNYLEREVKEKDLKNTVYSFTLEDGSEVELKDDEEIEYDGEVHTAANLFDALKEGYYGKF